MEQGRLEKYMKQRLEERTIAPSKQSWETLEQALDVQENSKSGKRFWYLGIAANIVGVLLIGQFYLKGSQRELSNDNPIKIENSVTNVINPVGDTDSEEKMPASVRKEGIITKPEEQTKKGANLAKTLSTKKTNVKTGNLGKNTAESSEALVVVDTENELINNIDSTSTGELKSDAELTDAYLEGLLAEAEQEIQIKKTKVIPKSEIVNSDDLLEGVEMDIERSFREKVLNVIVNGFGKVKTAVVERNR
ncbi:hypothetical protein [Formosa sp. S-31]|uniref:hypothetical protein n=1 Tax=Formosa sp. S-31 TaxID=2790949 RepID=UPI003EB9EA93